MTIKEFYNAIGHTRIALNEPSIISLADIENVKKDLAAYIYIYISRDGMNLTYF